MEGGGRSCPREAQASVRRSPRLEHLASHFSLLSPPSISRRAFLAGAVAALAPVALVGLTRKAPRRIAGGFVHEGHSRGHALRDGAAMPPPARRVRVPVVIVGGGVAGLSAAWWLDRRGVRDFVLLEMEPEAGGNARWGESEVARFPWAAHYVPVPGPRAALVRELFAELGVFDPAAAPGDEWDERSLCFEPKERIFAYGRWHDGLEAVLAEGPRDRDVHRRFTERVAELRAGGEFTIPMALGAPRASTLDELSMAEWLRRERLDAPSLGWLVDYACRDDYGAHAAATSAWAGLHYFAARDGGDRGPLTWPEGNGWVVRRLLEQVGDRVAPGRLAYHVALTAANGGRRVRVLTPGVEYLTDAVIFAAPTFLAPYVVDGARPPGFAYSPWLTANLTLDRWPRERGVGPAWDNVIRDSPALGYVVATHQSLRTFEERTVWTYYWALADEPPPAARRRLLAAGWRGCAEAILADLERAHPDVRDCVSRVDVMRLGHAMVRPAPGFLATRTATPYEAPAGPLRERLFFANSDLSGLSLFEEAQYRGVVAADRALALLGGGQA
jgi:glycine/D-amino acid oxidase-like deaminating enzyme